jgi:hypothetical protein
MEDLAKQLVMVAQSILKLDNPQVKRHEGKIITYIRVGDVSQRLAHEVKASEVALLPLNLLILL